MRMKFMMAGTAAIALAACSESAEMSASESVATMDIAEAEGEAIAEEAVAAPENADAFAESDAAGTSAPADAIEVSTPQIAYSYSLGFRVPTAAIKTLQEKHADMCETRGPKVCRIISMEQADSDGDYAYGNLQLAVAASSAREFAKDLEASSGTSDGELISSSIAGEDLSKQIVDTEARLRARTLLRDRLMEILRSRSGTVAELVEAERGVAQVNEEIDQARSWLNEMRGRVAFSKMDVRYESGSPSSGGFMDPIRSAWGSLGAVFGGLIAFLILAGAVLIPLGLIGWGVWRLWRVVRPQSSAANGNEGESPAEAASDS